MFILPEINFSFDSLEPVISQKTIEIHYLKHHQTYINKLNELLADLTEFKDYSLEEIIQNIDKFPRETQQSIFNNAGQVFNHNLYWKSISNKKQINPSENLLLKINSVFGDYSQFRVEWKNKGINQFGSGWVWLSTDSNKNLYIDSTANADSPLTKGRIPLLTMDVWEHAYYLDYQNLRPSYIDNFFTIIDWSNAQEIFDKV
jgi:superoxide dismutase, Fe-Mn family